MEKISKFKQEIARVFDDNLETVQWKNWVDYSILGLIGISTLAIFLSTYDFIAQRYSLFLYIIDYTTIIIFTIEVSLRIWCADLLDDKYKGFWGRIRYCFSFYGFIDIVSTYSFYVALIFPIPYMMFKVLRVARLIRVFRYIKAFNVLSRAIASKKSEMIVSLQFLCIITLMLSFILYFVEHEAQPGVYTNGWTSVLWAFMQYIGDPGGFADTPPITLVGRIIASVIGVLGIAIFAVPAGLIGSAFSEVMESDQYEEDCKKWVENLLKSFERQLDRTTGFQISPRYVTLQEIQARMNMKEGDILDAIRTDNHFRLINLACTQPVDSHPVDKLAIEYAPLNTPYGCMIDRGSKITITSFSNTVDPIGGWWSYYLAKIGGFNYISKELGSTRPYHSFYTVKEKYYPNQDIFMSDINQLLDNEDKWVINILPASGSLEPEYPEQFHFSYGAKKGDTSYTDPNITLNDIATFDNIYSNVKNLLNNKYELEAEKQIRHNNASPAYYVRHLDKKVNAITIRIAWSVLCWDTRAIQICQDLATIINTNINNCTNPEIEEMKLKDFAYEGYKN